MSSCPFALNNFPEENRPVMSVNNANKAKTCEWEILSWKVPSEGFVFSFCYNFLSKKRLNFLEVVSPGEDVPRLRGKPV